MIGNGRESEELEDGVHGGIEQEDGKDEDLAEDEHRKGRAEGGLLSAADCDRFRDELADDDVQKRNEQIRECNRHAVRGYAGSKSRQPGGPDNGIEQGGECRFSDETKPDACQRYAHLADREIFVQVSLDPLEGLRVPVSGLGQRLDLRRPDLHSGELRQNEERIQQDEKEGKNQVDGENHLGPRPPALISITGIVNWFSSTSGSVIRMDRSSVSRGTLR